MNNKNNNDATTSETNKLIDSFAGEYRWLSNFYPIKIFYSGLSFPSVENAYQAAKTFSLVDRMIFTNLSAGQAKRMGKRLEIRPDWDVVKLAIMYDLCAQKFFSSMELQHKLVKTGDAVLIEGNDWGDEFWGQVNGVGTNHLGKILMKVRSQISELRKVTAADVTAKRE